MNERRRMTGIVTSNKMMKTVVVEITRSFRHPIYKKVVHTSKSVKAHDEIGCRIGDKVQIVETRPLSKDKRWVVETVEPVWAAAPGQAAVFYRGDEVLGGGRIAR